ncbi:Glucan endo-1,3-beta-glucosidase 6 [Triticum urartu]|uniref:Glucan endo-1,3-beta-glucosidase 6 n=1 Tax=Triticum urartu TaxID=4572 RepID=M7ZZC3_TRIUA|nr:Glucan endo-1,3-beta-glucosidase 6 [Triticum urartu]
MGSRARSGRGGAAALFVAAVMVVSWSAAGVGAIGANWGTQASHPLPPDTVVKMLKDNGFQKVKLFDAEDGTMSALRESGLEVMVGIPNELLAIMASSMKAADKWVEKNVSNYLNKGCNVSWSVVSFDSTVVRKMNCHESRVSEGQRRHFSRYVAVGNEPFLSTYNGSFLLTTFPALKNIQSALVKAGLGNQIKVTVPQNADVYDTATGKPSDGDFRTDIHDRILEIVKFLSDTGGVFTVNIYPFISLYIDPNFPAEYAFFDGRSQPVVDGSATYTNMFDANHDTLIWALKKNGYGNLPIVIGEIGWPTDGDMNANAQLAQRFNQGFMTHIATGQGTPMRPGPIDAYLFSLIDEDDKSIQPGNFERHWGIYTYDGIPKYQLNFGVPNSQIKRASGVKYLDKKWCVLKPTVSLDDPKLPDTVSYACARADCTSLGYRTSCGMLDTRSNISYAYNSFYQKNDQDDVACGFSGYATTTGQDPSTGTCSGCYRCQAASYVGIIVVVVPIIVFLNFVLALDSNEEAMWMAYLPRIDNLISLTIRI